MTPFILSLGRCLLIRSIAVLGVALGVVCAAQAQVADTKSTDLNHDFRGKPLPADLTLFQPKDAELIKLEPEGLRIRLPKDRKPLSAVGVARAVPIKGDFQITLTYEILEVEAPPPNTFGVGVNVYLKKAEPRAEGATLCRLVQDNGRQVAFWDRSRLAPGKEPAFEGNSTACEHKLGRLRLQRTGTILHYLVAPGSVGDDFEEIQQTDFGTDDIQLVELRGTSGRYPAKLDARFLELRIRSGAIEPIAAAPAVPVATAPTPTRRLWWLVIGLFLILLLIAAALAARRAARRSTQSRSPER